MSVFVLNVRYQKTLTLLKLLSFLKFDLQRFHTLSINPNLIR